MRNPGILLVSWDVATTSVLLWVATSKVSRSHLSNSNIKSYTIWQTVLDTSSCLGASQSIRDKLSWFWSFRFTSSSCFKSGLPQNQQVYHSKFIWMLHQEMVHLPAPSVILCHLGCSIVSNNPRVIRKSNYMARSWCCNSKINCCGQKVLMIIFGFREVHAAQNIIALQLALEWVDRNHDKGPSKSHVITKNLRKVWMCCLSSYRCPVSRASKAIAMSFL